MTVSSAGLRQGTLAALAATFTFLSAPAHAASDGNIHARNVAIQPPKEKVGIEVVKVAGSGCPAHTTAVAISPDNSAFTLTYSKYLAQVGNGAPAVESRKNCHLDLRVNVPQGYTYAITGTDYRGFASLQTGAVGIHEASYFFQGGPPPAAKITSFRGAYNDNWQVSHQVDIDALVYAPCGEQRNFNINTQLRVMAGSSDSRKATSFMAMDSADSSVKTVYRFTWKHCG
ncbi:MAG: DUF4360 domain-containing protein [Longispora sp.]|nr:DUF4360 domain-containing protein [Longispora sp. (in: high G+C Gram-positive bacteria)]